MMIILILLAANFNKSIASNSNLVVIGQMNINYELNESEVIDSLVSLRNYYYEVYYCENSCNRDETMSKIEKLSEYIETKTMNGNNKGNNGNREFAEFNVSPNCTCNWLNYYSGEPCANCQHSLV